MAGSSGVTRSRPAAASHSGDVGFEYLYHLGEFAGALRHLAEHGMSVETFIRKFEEGPKAKDADWHTMMILAQAASFDPDPTQFCGIRLPVDLHTGRYLGPNCHGEEKVRRFREAFPGAQVDTFYSDSHSDDPMARIARKAVLVRGEKLLPWN